MVRVVHAEKCLIDRLNAESGRDRVGSGNLVGLIIGQSNTSQDYVVQMPRTCVETGENALTGNSQVSLEPLNFNTPQEIDESLIADHAKRVTRMLPGGIHVIGVFVYFSNTEPDESLEPTWKKILNSIKKILSNEPFPALHYQSDLLIFHYKQYSNNYICKAVKASGSGSTLEPVKWIIKNNPTKWYQISSKFDMNWPPIGGKTSLQLKTQLKSLLSDVNKLLDTAVFVINGKVHDCDHDNKATYYEIKKLIKCTEDEKDGSNNDITVSILTPLKDSLSANEDLVVTDCDVELNLMGVLVSQVFLSQNATIEEAIKYVKEDIVRSLAIRLELHWDSLIEEEYGSPEEKQSIHEPPRRVSISLSNCPVSFNDYIFPGEGANEVFATVKEVLDINNIEANVNEEFEIHGDLSDLCRKSVVNISSTSSDGLLSSTLPTGFLIAALSFAVMLIGIAIVLQIQRH